MKEVRGSFKITEFLPAHRSTDCFFLSLAVYQHQDDKVRLSTALAISTSIPKKVESNEEAFIEKDADDEDVGECDEGNAFLLAWRLGQKRFRGVYGESDEDYEEDLSTKKQKKMINNYYIYNAR